MRVLDLILNSRFVMEFNAYRRREFGVTSFDIAFLKKQSNRPMAIAGKICSPSELVRKHKYITADALKQQHQCYDNFRDINEYLFKVYRIKPRVTGSYNAWYDVKDRVWYPYTHDSIPFEVKHPMINLVCEFFN